MKISLLIREFGEPNKYKTLEGGTAWEREEDIVAIPRVGDHIVVGDKHATEWEVKFVAWSSPDEVTLFVQKPTFCLLLLS